MSEKKKAEQKDQAPSGVPKTDLPPSQNASPGNPPEGCAQSAPSPNPDDNNAVYGQRSMMQGLRQNEDEHLWRKLYLQKSFYLVGTVLYLTTFIVVLVGVGVIDLSDAVLITMLGTTVAHVVGILAIAFHWLYPRHG